ncbi:MAG: SlyX family protein [Verrucomicrobiota bacterium]
MSNESIQDLEVKISFLERHVEEQDRVILELRQEIDLMKSELLKVKETLESKSDTAETSPAEERPPHY